jgi:hypothetical protein
LSAFVIYPLACGITKDTATLWPFCFYFSK